MYIMITYTKGMGEGVNEIEYKCIGQIFIVLFMFTIL